MALTPPPPVLVTSRRPVCCNPSHLLVWRNQDGVSVCHACHPHPLGYAEGAAPPPRRRIAPDPHDRSSWVDAWLRDEVA